MFEFIKKWCKKASEGFVTKEIENFFSYDERSEAERKEEK